MHTNAIPDSAIALMISPPWSDHKKPSGHQTSVDPADCPDDRRIVRRVASRLSALAPFCADASVHPSAASDPPRRHNNSARTNGGPPNHRGPTGGEAAGAHHAASAKE